LPVIAGFRRVSQVTRYAFCSSRSPTRGVLHGPLRRRRRLADYVTVATLALQPAGDDSAESLVKAEGLAATVRLYAEGFEAGLAGGPEVVRRFARMLLALEEFELAGLCPEQRIERERRIERHRCLLTEDDLG